jgi:hypothetical protein
MTVFEETKVQILVFIFDLPQTSSDIMQEKSFVNFSFDISFNSKGFLLVLMNETKKGFSRMRIENSSAPNIQALSINDARLKFKSTLHRFYREPATERLVVLIHLSVIQEAMPLDSSCFNRCKVFDGLRASRKEEIVIFFKELSKKR